MDLKDQIQKDIKDKEREKEKLVESFQQVSRQIQELNQQSQELGKQIVEANAVIKSLKGLLNKDK